MGGAIALLASQGHKVLLLDLTDGEPTPRGDPVTRAKESDAAAEALSAPGNPVRRVQLGLRNRFVEHTVEARHKVAGVIRAWQAQIVFTPYFEDAHPDHLAATRVVEDARFDAKLTKIEMPTPTGLDPGPPIYPRWLFHYYASHLRITPAPSFVIDITPTFDRKMGAVAAYRSQFELNPANRQVPEWIRAEAVYFGSRIGTAAGEPFFAREPLGLNGFGSLLL